MTPAQDFYDKMFTNIENIFDEIRARLSWLVWILNLFKKG